ncbi:hypothetical protein ACFV5N_10645 [Streptomyces sp. NPDC059853]|uniref:hypothetical protein n=1 Tax=Streptomyces sp. NPDC059853 TaxID=3346973 RepID=UPI00364C4B70
MAAERVEPMGRIHAVLANTVGAVLLAGGGTGAVLFTVAAVGEAETTVDAVVSGAVALFAALVGYVGLGTLLHNRDVRAATRRLITTGVDATAEVIGIGPEEVTSDGLSTQHELLLRVTGPGFAPFEARTTEPDDRFPGLVVGSRLAAVVDPVHRDFSLHRGDPLC